MTRARVGNAWSDDYSGQMCLGGLSVGRGGDGVQDGEQEAAAQPQPPLALGLAPGALPGPPSAVQHAREPLSTGCPSPWRPALPSPLPVPSLCRPSLWRRRELSPSEPHCAEKRYGTTAQLPAALPDPPGPGHHPDPSAAARRPPPCGPRGISCQRPWSRSPSPGLSPSHSRAAESFEKNAAGREGLLRTERLCGGNCCSALSPPRPPGGAALSAANAKPGARSPAGRSRTGQGGRGAEEAPGGGGGFLGHPLPALPTRQAEDGAQTGWADGSEPRASRPGACPRTAAGGLGPQAGLCSSPGCLALGSGHTRFQARGSGLVSTRGWASELVGSPDPLRFSGSGGAKAGTPASRRGGNPVWARWRGRAPWLPRVR